MHNRDILNRQDALFASMRKKFKLRDDSVSGLLECKKPYACNEDAAYQAIDYRTPDGILLVFACRADCSGRLRQCFGGYLLINNFVVNFSFQIDNLPIGEVPGADQELRRRLDVAEVKDFKWYGGASLPDAAA
ncbi:MAG: hypothetical protein EOO77_14470 [Oxalobacteraceae bacterium]|nr:MAG: hypothetical protein EOO77_14470 [Oxalobacteraceae bacterium]